MNNDDLRHELRRRNLKNLITEAVVLALYEQEQMALPPAPPAAGAPPTAAEQQPTPPPDAQVPPQVQAPQEQVAAQQITLDLIIERLNIIRGGKSFTDPEVYGQMTTYVKSLSDQDKQAVYKFLVQTSKIVTSNAQVSQEQQPQQNVTPDQQPQPQQPAAPIAPTQTAPQAPPSTAPITPTPGAGGL